MTSYLRRLVERVHGRADVLRPLVPSRFEPAPDAPPEPPASLLERHEERVAAPAARTAANAIAAADGGPASAKSQPGTTRDAPQPALQPIAQRVPEHGGASPAVQVQVREAAPMRDPGEGAALEERALRTVARALASERWPAVAPAPLPTTREAAAPERVIEREVRPDPRRPVAEGSPTAPPPAPARSLPAAPPPLPQRREVAARQVPAAAAAEPAPAIHVTIGRVEVRALAQPPPARAGAPRATSGASLDDYLRRRDRGTP
jgi:hypothetical protein